jgi:nicotinamide mononucleotide (NMN) deamidase PncC
VAAKRGRPAKIPAAVVQAALTAYAAGVPVRVIASRHSVSPQYVRQLARGARRPSDTCPLPTALAAAVNAAPPGAIDRETGSVVELLRTMSAEAVRASHRIGWSTERIAAEWDFDLSYVRAIIRADLARIVAQAISKHGSKD